MIRLGGDPHLAWEGHEDPLEHEEETRSTLFHFKDQAGGHECRDFLFLKNRNNMMEIEKTRKLSEQRQSQLPVCGAQADWFLLRKGRGASRICWRIMMVGV